MTALCGGGTSGPTLGAAAITTIGAGLATYLLERYGYGWLKPLGIFAGVPDITVSAFCGTDPPAIPTFTSAETDALLKAQFGSADWDSGLSKLGDLIQHQAWYELCQCTSGALVPFPASPGQPAGSAVIAVPPGPAVQPCNQYNVTNTFAFTPGSGYSPLPVVMNLFGGLVASERMTIVNTPASGSPTASCFFEWANAAGGVLQNDTIVAGPGATVSGFFVGPPGAVTSTLGMTVTGTGSVRITGSTLELYCGNQQPGGVQQPCCPPDVQTTALLQQVLAQVNLLQRYRLPFATISGAVHSGATGTSSVPVPQLVGIKVAITAYPGSTPSLPGNPAYLENLGWISVSEAGGMIQERRISQAGFTWYPQMCELADHFNYFLNPGVTMTWTELYAEP